MPVMLLMPLLATLSEVVEFALGKVALGIKREHGIAEVDVGEVGRVQQQGIVVADVDVLVIDLAAVEHDGLIT